MATLWFTEPIIQHLNTLPETTGVSTTYTLAPAFRNLMLALYDSTYYDPGMNSKHRKTLEAIFSQPVNGNMEWRKIEALFLALGAMRTERSGSAVSFVLHRARADFHRPHPDKAALRYRVKDARRFLEMAGVTP